MLPNKLTHGEKLDDLFRKYNEMVDYLRETRLVAGPGMRINRLPSGTTIESTAKPGGLPSAPPKGHPFDAKIINKGSEGNPQYYVRIYDSSIPDSSYAGIVFVGDWDIEVPTVELKVDTQNEFYVELTVSYDQTPVNEMGSSPPFTTDIRIYPYGSGSDTEDYEHRTVIAGGKLPNVASRVSGDISVYGRYI